MLVSRAPDDADTPAVPVQDAYLEAEPQKAETAEAQGKEEPWCAYNDQMTDMLLNAIFGTTGGQGRAARRDGGAR